MFEINKYYITARFLTYCNQFISNVNLIEKIEITGEKIIIYRYYSCCRNDGSLKDVEVTEDHVSIDITKEKLESLQKCLQEYKNHDS